MSTHVGVGGVEQPFLCVVTRFDTWPTGGSPTALVRGPDGNLWFPEDMANQIARITPAGKITEYKIDASGGLGRIAVGPDGNLWFTFVTGFPSSYADVDRITLDGSITYFRFTTAERRGAANDLAAGPDGNLWITDSSDGVIVRMKADGSKDTLEVPTGADPDTIIAGPDGNLWFTAAGHHAIGRMTPVGSLSEFALPDHPEPRLTALAFDASGDLWYTYSGWSTDFVDEGIGRLASDGTVKEFPLPGGHVTPWSIVAGPDGNMWFSENGQGKVGRITPEGSIDECQVTRASARLGSMAVGADNHLWIAEIGAQYIDRLEVR